MPDDRKAEAHAAPPGYDPARARRDHQAISRLVDELLPTLIAKLASSGLGEIEVRESGWRARLRKPAGSDGARRAAGRSSSEGHAGPGHAAGRLPTTSRATRTGEEDAEQEPTRIGATSPAVGVYHPRHELTVGMRVRAGEKIGTVDVLGVNQDVVVPVDGIIGASLAEAGEAVEYGQELVRIELAEPGSGQEVAPGQPEPAGARGKA